MLKIYVKLVNNLGKRLNFSKLWGVIFPNSGHSGQENSSYYRIQKHGPGCVGPLINHGPRAKFWVRFWNDPAQEHLYFAKYSWSIMTDSTVLMPTITPSLGVSPFINMEFGMKSWLTIWPKVPLYFDVGYVTISLHGPLNLK